LEQASFATALNRHRIVGVDSMVFIYHVEAHPSYLPLTRALFKHIETGKIKAVTSMLSLTEVLIQPYRKGRRDLAVFYRALLTEYPHLEIRPLDLETAELAAAIRARYETSTPDGIQTATAMQQGATAFITNDRRLARVKELDIVLLDSYL